VVVVTLFQERCIGGFGEIRFVIQQVEDSDGFLGYQTDDRLVISETDVLPLNFLFGVFLLFQFENVLVEVKLQVFVGIVDAHLFKTVLLLGKKGETSANRATRQ
jgi:hypothetical protein